MDAVAGVTNASNSESILGSPDLITVVSYKYDGSISRTWPAIIREINGPLIIAAGTFSNTIEHPFLGTMEAGTLSLEYFWTDRLYNIFELSEPNGRFRGFYCNLALPVKFDGATLSYVDLDIDIAVAPDSSIRVLDEDEFNENSIHLNYPADLTASVRDSLKALEKLILARQFPFDRHLATSPNKAI